MTPQFSVGSSCCVHVCLALHIMGPESAYLFMRLDPNVTAQSAVLHIRSQPDKPKAACAGMLAAPAKQLEAGPPV
jgi:hypothetical protein